MVKAIDDEGGGKCPLDVPSFTGKEVVENDEVPLEDMAEEMSEKGKDTSDKNFEEGERDGWEVRSGREKGEVDGEWSDVYDGVEEVDSDESWFSIIDELVAEDDEEAGMGSPQEEFEPTAGRYGEDRDDEWEGFERDRVSATIDVVDKECWCVWCDCLFCWEWWWDWEESFARRWYLILHCLQHRTLWEDDLSGNFIRSEVHDEQNILPQKRQWWCRWNSVNGREHPIHSVTPSSGYHSGGFQFIYYGFIYLIYYYFRC